jgi:hypothetical protein
MSRKRRYFNFVGGLVFDDGLKEGKSDAYALLFVTTVSKIA